MGTHPIFESDFDCLTEMFEKSNGEPGGGDDDIKIEISDAISEKDIVKFTINVASKIGGYDGEFKVIRSYSDFVWLHTSLSENELYQGLLIPPKPYRPDFEQSGSRFSRIKETETQMSQEEKDHLKSELESEYLALFKKTVAMHEAFLVRIVNHEKLRNDHDLRIFLTYDGELSVRGKNAKEKLTGWFSKGQQAFDTIMTDKVNDPDEFYEEKKLWLNEYHTRVADGRKKSCNFTKQHHDIGGDYGQIGILLGKAAVVEAKSQEARKVGLDKLCDVIATHLPKLKKWEVRAGTDTELKLNDMLRYYDHETSAAKDLLYRRQKTLELVDKRTRELEVARVKNRDIVGAERKLEESREKFDTLSELGRGELKRFGQRRVDVFTTNLRELGELQVKHARNRITVLESLIDQMEKVNTEL